MTHSVRVFIIVLCLGLGMAWVWRIARCSPAEATLPPQSAPVETNTPARSNDEATAASPVTLKREYPLTQFSETQAVNSRVLQVDGKPMLVYAHSISETDRKALPRSQYTTEDKARQRLAFTTGLASLGTIPFTPGMVDWGSSGHGDFGICAVDRTSGYLLASTVHPLAGQTSTYFEPRWYSWSSAHGQLQIQALTGGKRPCGYLNPDLSTFKDKVVVAAESLDSEGREISVAIITDPTQSCNFVPIAKYEPGAYPRLLATSDTLYLMYPRFVENSLRMVSSAQLRITSSTDGATWESPRSIPHALGVVQAAPAIDEHGNLFVLYSTIVRDAGSKSGVYNFTCGLQAVRKTSLWLTWSTDSGNTWAAPQRVTDGTHADHYPELTVLDGHLRLLWTRYTSTVPENPYMGTVAGNLITADYGETTTLVAPTTP